MRAHASKHAVGRVRRLPRRRADGRLAFVHTTRRGPAGSSPAADRGPRGRGGPRPERDARLATDELSAGRMLADPRYVEEKVAGERRDRSTSGGRDGDRRRGVHGRDAPCAAVRPDPGAGARVRREPDRRAAGRGVGRAAGRRRKCAGTVVVEIAGALVRLTGRCALQPVGPSATRLRYDGDLQAQILLLGSAVEEAAARAICGALWSSRSPTGGWQITDGPSSRNDSVTRGRPRQRSDLRRRGCGIATTQVSATHVLDTHPAAGDSSSSAWERSYILRKGRSRAGPTRPTSDALRQRPLRQTVE